LAAAGEPGVARAIQILSEELRRNMALMGCAKISDINRELIVSPTR
jgi:isopentenyl diphosphate isomerase/L-lactate dehydrogenase-like FMN-dependent dehydrogenase